jgi:sterol 3beta-glucosyltransferase
VAHKGYVFNGRTSPLLHLGLASSHYYATPSDLASYRPCGFTSWTNIDDPLPADVVRYLDAGDPPVVVTLGTSAASAAASVFGMAAAALDALGLRGLFLTGNAANASSLHGREGVWSFVPLAPVLARCRAIVQSGAHGTNAIALTSGTPSVVVPMLFDQVWHGAHNAELGIGTMVRKPTVERLVDAIRHVTADPCVAATARSFAALLRAEDGDERVVTVATV